MTNTSKHTPGPWVFDQDNGGFVWTTRKNAEGHRMAIFQTSGELRGAFSHQDFHWNGGHEEVRANARLIAAAPELLEALQVLLEVHKRMADGFVADSECEAAVDQAEAAISKASGRTA